MGQNNENQIFMLCIENKDCEEDYLYPESYFISVQLPKKAQEALYIGS